MLEEDLNELLDAFGKLQATDKAQMELCLRWLESTAPGTLREPFLRPKFWHHCPNVWYTFCMSATETYDDLILADLQGALTPQAAEGILSLQFSAEQQRRMGILADKARSGELTDNERQEADGYERVSSLLGIIQSRARMSLRNAAS